MNKKTTNYLGNSVKNSIIYQEVNIENRLDLKEFPIMGFPLINSTAIVSWIEKLKQDLLCLFQNLLKATFFVDCCISIRLCSFLLYTLLLTIV